MLPITTSQIELMQMDNIASPSAPGFDALGLSPRAIEEILPQISKQAATADANASPLPGPDPIVGPLSEEGFRPLFDGTAATFSQWRLSGPTGGGMRHANGEMLSYGEGGLRLFYYATETFADFTLRLQFKVLDAAKHNSGVFLRFTDPAFDLPPALKQRVVNEPSFDPDNAAWRPVVSGFEVQIDDNAIGDSAKDFHGIRPEPDGLYKNRTGAIYKIEAGDRIWHQDRNEPVMQTYTPGPPLIPGVWFEYEIVVRGDDYTVFLTNTLSGERRKTTSFHNSDGDRGRAPGLHWRAGLSRQRRSLAAHPHQDVAVNRPADMMRTSIWSDIDCRQSRIAAWPGLNLGDLARASQRGRRCWDLDVEMKGG